MGDSLTRVSLILNYYRLLDNGTFSVAVGISPTQLESKFFKVSNHKALLTAAYALAIDNPIVNAYWGCWSGFSYLNSGEFTCVDTHCASLEKSLEQVAIVLKVA